MQRFSPLRCLLACAFVLAGRVVDAQGSGLDALSECAFTVTFVPPPLTVTVFTGILNASDLIPDVPSSLSSILPGLPTSDLGSVLATLTGDISLPGSLSLPTDALSTDILPGLSSLLSVPTPTLPDLSITLPTSLSLPTLSPDITLPSVVIPTLSITDGLPTSDLVGILTTSLSDLGLSSLLDPSLPTISLPTLTSPGSLIPSDLSLSLNLPSLTLSLPDDLPTGLPTIQSSSLLSAPSVSVTLPAVSLTSGLTTLIPSLTVPSLSSPALSLSLPTLSLSLTLSDLNTSLAIPTGLSISLGSVTALPGLPSTLPSGVLPPIFGAPTTASTTAIPTASVLPLIYCPGDNGMNYLSPGNQPYQVQCNMRRTGRTLSQNPSPNLQECMNSCDDVSDCEAVSYNSLDGTCYTEGDDTTGSPNNDFLSASTIDLSCPGADGVQYMDYLGTIYQIYCDYAFPQSSNITTSPATNYLECSSGCSQTSTCSGFTFTDGVCTYTQNFGDMLAGSRRNGTNTVLNLAKRAVKVGPGNTPVIDNTAIASNLPPAITSILLPPTQSLPTLSLPTITSLDVSSLLSLTTLLPTSLPTQLSLPSLIDTIINLPSATIPTSQLPTQTPVAYTCPSVDGRIVVENGLSYVMNCSSTTDGIPYSSRQAATSFNDCFRECDQSSTLGGANYCTAFTYEGAVNGAGSGTCYLYNGVSQSFSASGGRNTITAIRAVNYVPAAVVGGVTSILPGVPSIGVSVSATLAASVTLGAGVGVSLPSVSNSLIPVPASNSLSITGTCDNGGDILNGCVLATATLDPGVGVSGGISIGPSSSPILGVSLSASVGASVSAGVSLGVGLSAGSSGMSLGVSPSVGLGAGASGGLGGGLGGGGAPAQATATTTSSSARISATPGASSPSTASTTSYYVTPLGPVVTTTSTPSPSLSTTTVFTTSTVTSCLTGLGGVLTCPLGGLFTTLSSTSGAVTSISTSTQTSISVSISYITVTASSSSSSRSSSFSTITTFSSRTSSSSRATSTSTCAGVVNAVGLCVL